MINSRLRNIELREYFIYEELHSLDKIYIRDKCKFIIIIVIIIIIIKDWQRKAGRGKLSQYQSEDPSPTLPTFRGKEEKGKIVEDKK